MLLKLALRNLLQHRSKSMIVGALMAFGVTLLVTGNSIMHTLSTNMQASFTQQYSGDLFIYADSKAIELQQRQAKAKSEAAKSDQEANRLASRKSRPDENQAQSTSRAPEDDNTSIFSGFRGGSQASLPSYGEQSPGLSQLPYISQLSPQTVGFGSIENGIGAQARTMLWGVDQVAWQDIGFSQHLQWIDGGLWQPGSAGIALNQSVADAYSKSQGQAVQVGDEIQIAVTNDAGPKIRSLIISGIFNFKTTAAPQLGFMSLIDLTTSQGLFSLNVDTSVSAELSADDQAMIGQTSESDLFGGGLFENAVTSESDAASIEAELLISLQVNRPSASQASQQYHFVIVQLAPGIDGKSAKRQLEQWIKQQELEWKVGDWEQAAGFTAQMANNVGWVLNGFMVLIAAVSIIIIMNTLVISVTERIVEIGTMRAMGAQKSLVRRLILLETLVLAIAAGVAGIAMAAIITGILGNTGISPPNAFFALIFGGEQLYPSLSINAVVSALGMMIVAALVASLYPLAIALKVSPVTAMQS
jgi:putative ABC transport system permease protein